MSKKERIKKKDLPQRLVIGFGDTSYVIVRDPKTMFMLGSYLSKLGVGSTVSNIEVDEHGLVSEIYFADAKDTGHEVSSNVEDVKAQIMALNGMNTSSTHTINVVKRESEGQSITYEESLRRAGGEKAEQHIRSLILRLLDIGITPDDYAIKYEEYKENGGWFIE
ncbi:hypothetical protein RhoFasSB10_02306 [Rhodococcus fascians]|uniref:hypothetical protein n=1 Tax=Rhodococcoides fascians TaxID=1828 RepID=UPI001427C7A6|nr:hypothetical protein [Rhodococcus fascians]